MKNITECNNLTLRFYAHSFLKMESLYHIQWFIFPDRAEERFLENVMKKKPFLVKL